MKNKYAFTLIEIMVVISITVIISVSGMSYFFNFLGSFDIKQNLDQIKTDISELDQQIRKFDIIDYEYTFDTLSGSYASTLNKNSIGLDKYSKIDFNSEIGIAKLNIFGGDSSEIWTVRNYKGNKISEVVGLAGDEEYEYLFDGNKNYTIRSEINSEEINEININYFIEENIYKTGGELVLIGINSEKDFSGINYTSLTIRNISGKKTFHSGGLELLLDKIYLKFEKNGVEEKIELTK